MLQPVDGRRSAARGKFHGFAFIPLLDEPESTDCLDLLKSRLSASWRTPASCVKPPLSGPPFSSTVGGIASKLDSSWLYAVPAERTLVLVMLHEPGLERWLGGMDIEAVVGVSRAEDLALYAGLDNVRTIVGRDGRILAELVMRTYGACFGAPPDRGASSGAAAGEDRSLGNPPPVSGSTTSSAASAAQPLLRVEHLCKHLEASDGRGLVILDDVSFAVPASSLFAVTGPSGSGKSTLLNLLTGLDRPTTGRIMFGESELRGRSEDELARWRSRNVGIVFQFFQLIPTLTALENVMLALELGDSTTPRRLWRERSLECLRVVGLTAQAGRLPPLLSGGEQQRVAIARAIANNPPVVVADEPTGNLDSTSALAVFDVLAGLTKRGKTVLYVTHDATLAARSTAGFELRDGRIVARHGPEYAQWPCAVDQEIPR